MVWWIAKQAPDGKGNKKMNYRHEARQSLKRAKTELSAQDERRLKYAALKLRMAMECLTYDRALAFKDEFLPKEYETWQPRKVLAVLLEIDGTADKYYTISVGVEDAVGKPATNMEVLGTDKVLNMETLRKHYDALGSYLHVLKMKQAKAGATVNFEKLRTRCETITAFIEEVLASKVFNATMGNFSSSECAECGRTIRKRIPVGAKTVEAECFECGASYTLTDEGSGKIRWKPHVYEIGCGNTDCDHRIQIWRHECQSAPKTDPRSASNFDPPLHEWI